MKVVKYVAGGGKTTYSKKYMLDNTRGLYLAYTNSVVDELASQGILSKTIDSLFQSFFIPKFIDTMPIVKRGSKIKYVKIDELPNFLKGIGNISLKENGDLYNGNSKIDVNIQVNNDLLFNKPRFKNDTYIKYIFSQTCLNLTDKLRGDIAKYLLKNYENQLIELVKQRFNFVIVDEAQDLKDYREDFVRMLYNSQIDLILLGDEYQNICGGGEWFQNLPATEIQTKSHRCSDNICKWIRDNLNIEIYGNDSDYAYYQIELDEVYKYNDGEAVLLYNARTKKFLQIIDNWIGEKMTIRTAKGQTINRNIVVIGESLSIKNIYTAITRTKQNAFVTRMRINK